MIEAASGARQADDRQRGLVAASIAVAAITVA
jgi:hypothetical protein